VGGARMPTPAELPDAIAPLARRQALEIRDVSYDYDITRLIDAIEKVAAGTPVEASAEPEPAPEAEPEPPPEPPPAPPSRPATARSRRRWPIVAAGLAAIALAGGIAAAAGVFSAGDSPGDNSSSRGPTGGTPASHSDAGDALLGKIPASVRSDCKVDSGAPPATAHASCIMDGTESLEYSLFESADDMKTDYSDTVPDAQLSNVNRPCHADTDANWNLSTAWPNGLLKCYDSMGGSVSITWTDDSKLVSATLSAQDPRFAIDSWRFASGTDTP
jgi:hypothetical protein